MNNVGLGTRNDPLGMGADAYLFSINVRLEASRALRGIMKQAHNRSRLGGLSCAISPSVCALAVPVEWSSPYHRRRSLEGPKPKQIVGRAISPLQVFCD